MLTVIMASHNGARTLPTVLEAYQRIEAPPADWKLVVADNASTDDTPAILQRATGLLPLTTLRVSTPGKNHALNAALDHREGDLVVFTDDDAIPSPHWLRELRRAADLHPEFDVFGGAILPRWEREPEAWLLDWVPHDMTYTLTQKGRGDGPLAATQVGGLNMAVRAELFNSGHRFDPRIGPKSGGTYAMGSETEFTLRMAQHGHQAWFVSGAVVEHMIRAFQMERRWILARAIRYGRCICRRDRQRGLSPPADLWGMPRWMFRDVAARSVSLLGAKLAGNARRAFEEAWHLHYDWGYLSEARDARPGVTGGQS